MINMQGSKGNAVAQEDGPSFTLAAMHGHDVHSIAVDSALTFQTRHYVDCADASQELAPTMRAMGANLSHANAGGQLVVASFHQDKEE